MEIITGLDFKLKNSSISLGKFDGIHIGHRYLLSQIMKQKRFVPTVFTFEMNTSSPNIYTQEEKNNIFQEIGIEREVIFPFCEETRNMLPQEFIEEILVKRMDAKYICVGKDFCFGRNRKGDIHTLERYASEYGYVLEAVDKLSYNDEIVSSTRVRSLIEKGNVETANAILGAPFFMIGKVLHGNQLGRTLNMPTANILPEEGKKLLPFGVYATTVQIADKQYFGVTNIGKKPTVGEYDIGVETYIMNFQEDIYGKDIQIHFHKFLRAEKKFENIEQLKKQIEADKDEAYAYLSGMC